MTEIAVTEPQPDITVLPPARPAASDAIGQLMAHAEAMSAAKQLGEALAGTDMVPKDYKGKPGNAAAAILYGAELGLNPIQSLQQIFVVHGSPAIYARTAVALVMRHGVTVETVATSAQSVTVRASDPRTGRVEECTWDIDRATTAGYTANDRYKKNPQEMLYAKAAMECCRKIAPDVLLGIPYAREELDLEEQPRKVHSERARGVDALRQKAAAAAPESTSAQAAPAEAGFTAAARQKWLNRMFALLGQADCVDRDDQLIVISSLAGRADTDHLEHRDALGDDELRRVVEALNAADKAGGLGAIVTDILNAYVERIAAQDDGADQ